MNIIKLLGERVRARYNILFTDEIIKGILDKNVVVLVGDDCEIFLDGNDKTISIAGGLINAKPILKECLRHVAKNKFNKVNK